MCILNFKKKQQRKNIYIQNFKIIYFTYHNNHLEQDSSLWNMWNNTMNKNWVSTITSEETPPGLEILEDLDKIAVYQQFELIEIITDFETENKYNILNPEKNQQILYAQEHTDCCNRNFCGKGRGFEMSICNIRNEEILHLTRYLRAQACCWFCCLQKMEIFAPPGKLLGTINQLWAFCKPKLVVKDSQGKSLFMIKGPFCVCGTVDFPVTSVQNGEEIGVIQKQWGGFGTEAFTDADVFGMDFKQHLSAEVRKII